MKMKSDPASGHFAGHEDSPPATCKVLKPIDSDKHLERVDLVDRDLVYDDVEHEPQLHVRTWVSLVAIWLFNYVIVIALLSPPAVASVPHSDFDMAVLDAFYRSHISEQASGPPKLKRGCQIRLHCPRRSWLP